MENMGNITFASGDILAFGNVYVLQVKSIEPTIKKANIVLIKHSATIVDKWFSEGSLLNVNGVITAHVYSIYTSNSGGTLFALLTDIVALGNNPPAGNEPTSGFCTEQWKCSLWGACSDGIQKRSCMDLNSCGTNETRPVLNKTCYVQHLPCVENWQCSAWSECINNQFTRTCVDINQCGTFAERPYNTLLCDPGNPNQQDPNNPDQNNPNGNPNNPPDQSDQNQGSSGSSSTTTIHKTTINNTNISYEYITIGGIPLPWSVDDFSPMIFSSLIILLILFLLLLLLYIYVSSAFSSIASKKDFSHPGVAWIPILGPLIISNRIAKMHWWPILLVIFVPFQFLQFLDFIIPIPPILVLPMTGLSSFALFVLAVFSFIWIWKTFKAVGKPGWWVLFNLIPVLGNIIFLILLGVVAWSKEAEPAKTREKNKKDK
jgi:uncharacterized membrane protein YhaH (DUF805 family)